MPARMYARVHLLVMNSRSLPAALTELPWNYNLGKCFAVFPMEDLS